jgi:hypothetical protein
MVHVFVLAKFDVIEFYLPRCAHLHCFDCAASPGKMNRKPGDWDCRACQHLNFSRRDLCQRCGEPRGAADRGSGGGGDYANFGGRGGSSFGGGFGAGSDVRPGDWLCNCGAHNFASRSNCFKCSAFKEEAAVNSGAGGFDGDMSRSRYGFGGGMGGGGGAARTNRPGWKSGDWICTRCVSLNPYQSTY